MITDNIIRLILGGLAFLYIAYMMYFGLNVMLYQLFNNSEKTSYLDIAIKSGIEFVKMITIAFLVMTPFFIIIYIAQNL